MGNDPEASETTLGRVTNLVAYLQRAFGYSLTGHTSEKIVFLAHGSGNNGKTTLLSLFRDLIDEYSVLLSIDTLMVRQESNKTQADLADLRGARFVMTSETEEGQRLAEGKLKRITQGMGRIKAVRKYENPIEFDGTHKLWMDCNHRPVLRGTDNAIWNRLHLLPFHATIRDAEIDHDLKAKLLAEEEGILAWATEGAHDWYRNRLGKPPEVTEAVQEYREEMDQIGRFLSECCIILPTATAKGRAVYAVYKRWADSGGAFAITQTMLGRKLAERRIVKRHTEKGEMYVGLGLRTEEF
jgi:putative DNA primase/helicase